MFGYLRIQKSELLVREYEAYKAVYCGLCKQLGKDYSFFTRLILSYDCTFYAMILMSLERSCKGFYNGRCKCNPLKKCQYARCESDSYSKAAAFSVISAYYKLLDDLSDSGFFKRLAVRIIKPFFKHWHKKAVKRYPELDPPVEEMMRAQRDVEARDDPEIDAAAHPTAAMLANYDEINAESALTYQDGAKHSIQTFIVLTVILVLLALVGALVVAQRIVKPIEHMTRRINSLSGSDSVFEMEQVYRTDDEIEILAESFASLSKKTRDYIQQITEITAEKERIGTELALATRIQADMLPNIFPAFPERVEFDIYASMDPAKEVGGDFYDFFLVDDDHLCMLIADVSGKGVPAALFMMASRIILASNAKQGKSPAAILESTNETICQNNREEMFVTVWLGILEISTGRLTAANAGHEYPVLMQPDGKFELVKDKHGFVIGGMEGMRYKEYELTLTPGSKLFLYTDGVPEATNTEGELFGTERMLAALNEKTSARPEEMLKNMRRAVDGFVKDAEQFDDLTMLGFEFKGTRG